MIEDHAQLAMAGGRMPVGADQPAGDTSGLMLWVRRNGTPPALLAFADRHRLALWTAMLCFYLAAFNGQWRIQSDAALYLSIGRNLAHGLGFTYLGEPNHLAYPGWPGLIALTFKLFGAKSLAPVNLLMMLMSLATVAMVYRLFLLHSGRPTAVVISIGVGLTKAFFCYGFELWSDMPFALGAICTLAGYEGLFGRRGVQSDAGHSNNPRAAWKHGVDWFLLIGGLLFAAAMRPTIWPLLAALGLAMIAETFRRRIRWRILIGVIAVAIAVTVLVMRVDWLRRPARVRHGVRGISSKPNHWKNRQRGEPSVQ